MIPLAAMIRRVELVIHFSHFTARAEVPGTAHPSYHYSGRRAARCPSGRPPPSEPGLIWPMYWPAGRRRRACCVMYVRPTGELLGAGAAVDGSNSDGAALVTIQAVRAATAAAGCSGGASGWHPAGAAACDCTNGCRKGHGEKRLCNTMLLESTLYSVPFV